MYVGQFARYIDMDLAKYILDVVCVSKEGNEYVNSYYLIYIISTFIYDCNSTWQCCQSIGNATSRR